MNKLTTLSVAAAVSTVLATTAFTGTTFADSANVYLAPASLNQTSSTFSVGIYENSDVTVNAANLTLHFSSAVQVNSVNGATFSVFQASPSSGTTTDVTLKTGTFSPVSGVNEIASVSFTLPSQESVDASIQNAALAHPVDSTHSSYVATVTTAGGSYTYNVPTPAPTPAPTSTGSGSTSNSGTQSNASSTGAASQTAAPATTNSDVKGANTAANAAKTPAKAKTPTTTAVKKSSHAGLYWTIAGILAVLAAGFVGRKQLAATPASKPAANKSTAKKAAHGRK